VALHRLDIETSGLQSRNSCAVTNTAPVHARVPTASGARPFDAGAIVSTARARAVFNQVRERGTDGGSAAGDRGGSMICRPRAARGAVEAGTRRVAERVGGARWAHGIEATTAV